MENGIKILEEHMWESKQLIRDLCLDWWKERKEKQIQSLQHLLKKDALIRSLYRRIRTKGLAFWRLQNL